MYVWLLGNARYEGNTVNNENTRILVSINPFLEKEKNDSAEE